MCFSDSVGALPFPLKGALMPATWSKAYLTLAGTGGGGVDATPLPAAFLEYLFC